MAEILRELEPPTPSDRLSSLASSIEPSAGSSLTKVSKARRLAPGALRDLLRRELNLLPMKAMQRNPVDRYRSAVELADDIRNYLDDRPLIAAPPSAVYRARKFVRRNAGTVLAGAVVAVALVLSTALSVAFGVSANRAWRQEEQRRKEVTRIAKFQQRMLEQVRPQQAGEELFRSLEGRLRDSMRGRGAAQVDQDEAIKSLRGQLARLNPTDVATDFLQSVILQPAITESNSPEFKEQSLVQAGLHQTLAIALFNLDESRKAEPWQQSALSLRRQHLPGDDRDLLESEVWMGRVLLGVGRTKDAEEHLKTAMAGRAAFSADDPDTRDSLESLLFLAATQKDWPEANRIMDELRRPSPASSLPERLRLDSSFAMLQVQGGFPEEAVRTMEQTLRFRDDPGVDAELKVLLLNNMAEARRTLAKTLRDNDDASATEEANRAEQACREAMDMSGRVHGEEHSFTLGTRNLLAIQLFEAGKFEAGKFEDALNRAQRGLDLADQRGWNANTIVPLRLTIAQVMCEQGRVEEAWKFSLETEKLCERARTPMLIEALKSSASVAEELKWLEEAESRLRRVCSYYKFEVDDKRMTASDMEPIDAATNHGRVLMLMKRHREANEVLRPALDAARRRRPDSGALWAVAQQWFENLRSWPATEPGRPNLEQEEKLFNEVKEAREQALKQS